MTDRSCIACRHFRDANLNAVKRIGRVVSLRFNLPKVDIIQDRAATRARILGLPGLGSYCGQIITRVRSSRKVIHSQQGFHHQPSSSDLRIQK